MILRFLPGTAFISSLLLAALLGGCRVEDKLSCTDIYHAIENLQPQHVSGDTGFNKEIFTKALQAALLENGLEPVKFNPAQADRACIQTLWMHRQQRPQLTRSAVSVQILHHYMRQLDPHSGAYSQEMFLDVPMEEGFGLELAWSEIEKEILIEDVVVNSPAHKARLKPWTRVESINRVPISQIDKARLAEALAPSNDRLVLGIEGREVTLARAKYIVPPFDATTGRIGVIKVRHFVGSADTFATALHTVDSSEALVLDLRGVRGGKLEHAAEVANGLVSDGGPFVGFLNSKGLLPSETLTLRPGSLWDFPVVVLINSQTRSAAEVLAAALQDYGAILIGTTTFGKGTRQEEKSLSPFGLVGSVELTTAFTVRPSGRPIQMVGVQPDVDLYAPPSARVEGNLPGALYAPLYDSPLEGYDPSTLPFRSPEFRERLAILGSSLSAMTKRHAIGATRSEQEMSAAILLARFLVKESSPAKETGKGVRKTAFAR